MLNSDYLIIPWEWLEDALSGSELETLYEFLNRALFDKDEDSGFVTQEVPYQNEALDYMNKKKVKLTKEQLLDKLKELSKLEDSELAHVEAIEALLDYINDNEITNAYLSVPLNF